MGQDHESEMAELELVKAENLSTAVFARWFAMRYIQARFITLHDGNFTKRGPRPLFATEEEQVFVQFICINAIVGRGLSRDTCLRVCGALVSSLSAER